MVAGFYLEGSGCDRFPPGTIICDMRLNAAALHAIREGRGLSVGALATAAGVGHAHISNLEAGRRTASPKIAVAIAGALGVPLAAILADPDSKAKAS